LKDISGQVQFDGAGNFSIIHGGDVFAFTNVTLEGGHATARMGSKNLAALTTKNGLSVWVKLDGEQFCFEVIDPLDVTHTDGDNADCVFAPMTGVVSIIHVAAGDVVEKGDALLVLEAMKMEHALQAPRDGVIAEVLCSASSAVDEGAQLVVLEEVGE
jgi:3-methylcrotonyl-CoA carboxylase alpha subunit